MYRQGGSAIHQIPKTGLVKDAEEMLIEHGCEYAKNDDGVVDDFTLKVLMATNSVASHPDVLLFKKNMDSGPEYFIAIVDLRDQGMFVCGREKRQHYRKEIGFAPLVEFVEHFKRNRSESIAAYLNNRKDVFAYADYFSPTRQKGKKPGSILNAVSVESAHL